MRAVRPTMLLAAVTRLNKLKPAMPARRPNSSIATLLPRLMLPTAACGSTSDAPYSTSAAKPTNTSAKMALLKPRRSRMDAKKCRATPSTALPNRRLSRPSWLKACTTGQLRNASPARRPACASAVCVRVPSRRRLRSTQNAGNSSRKPASPKPPPSSPATAVVERTYTKPPMPNTRFSKARNKPGISPPRKLPKVAVSAITRVCSSPLASLSSARPPRRRMVSKRRARILRTVCVPTHVIA